jgi:TIR domain
MSDIFISYKREEQTTARKLADALEEEGWSVWWDPKLRAGERFNDVIEKALKESKCVVVMWSKRSVQSVYVKDEATYALNRNKLVPVMIEEVDLPFRFEGLQTPNLLEWKASKDSSEFQRLVRDISTILGPSGGTTTAVAEKTRVESQKSREERLPQTQQRTKDETQPRLGNTNPGPLKNEGSGLWRKSGPLAAGVSMVLIVLALLFWWPKRQESAQVEKQEPPKETASSLPAKDSPGLVSSTNSKVSSNPAFPNLFSTHEQPGTTSEQPDLMEGEYVLVSSTGPPDWQFSKGRLTVRKLGTQYLLFLLACGWKDKPTSSCGEWWLGKIRDGAIYVDQSRTSPLVNIDFRPKDRTLTLSYVSNSGASRTDVYRDAAGEQNTDRDLVRRMAREEDSWSGTVKDPTLGNYATWIFAHKVTR